MDLFTKAKAVKLRSHLDKYLVAGDDQVTVRQSRNSSSSKARWTVELVQNKSHVIRLKSCHGKYLTASDIPSLLGMTGKKVLQTVPDQKNLTSDRNIEWEPIRDGLQVILKSWCGEFLLSNDGTPPWRNTVTHGELHSSSTRNWILWDVVVVAPKLQIDPGPRLGNLQLYYDVWSAKKSNQPFFYWLDVGDGKEVNLEACPRIVCQSPCNNYLGPHENTEENSVLLSNTRSHDTEGNSGNNGVELGRKVTLERMFVITNFILALPSSVFDQLSSVHKPQYALIGMLTSVIAMLICIIELIYKVGKERVEWRWRRRSARNIILPWFYYSSPTYERRFGSLYDIVGLVCAICQCIVTIINYAFIYRHTDNPIKISVWPIIFAFGLLCSKFMEKRDMRSAT